MEKLLNAIASRLTVRTIAEQSDQTPKGVPKGLVTVTMTIFDHRDVTDEVKKLFKKELNNHLYTKLQEMEVGEYVDYGFCYGNERPLGTLMEDTNDNLAEVLLRLPALNEGEAYDLPCDTYIGFTLINKDKENASVKPTVVCPWIKEAYSNQ